VPGDTTAAGDTAAADSADTLDEGPSIPEKTEMEFEIQTDPPVRGTGSAFAQCRTYPSQDGTTTRYEVATTPAELESGAAALGLIIDRYNGPGDYTEKVTVMISLGTNRNPLNVLAGRRGCVAQVAGPLAGSFSCEGLVRRDGVDSVGVAGRGSWRCWD
jgi:hypothetical protein